MWKFSNVRGRRIALKRGIAKDFVSLLFTQGYFYQIIEIFEDTTKGLSITSCLTLNNLAMVTFQIY